MSQVSSLLSSRVVAILIHRNVLTAISWKGVDSDGHSGGMTGQVGYGLPAGHYWEKWRKLTIPRLSGPNRAASHVPGCNQSDLAKK